MDEMSIGSEEVVPAPGIIVEPPGATESYSPDNGEEQEMANVWDETPEAADPEAADPGAPEADESPVEAPETASEPEAAPEEPEAPAEAEDGPGEDAAPGVEDLPAAETPAE